MPATQYDQLLKRYAEYAPVYDRRWGRYSRATLTRALDAVVQLVPESGHINLLDVACGTGIFADMLRKEIPCIHIAGVDLSADMLMKFRDRFAGEERITAHTGSAENLPFDDGCFDILTCNNAFHLIADATAALREFRRVIRPGGHVVIVDWCRDFLPMKALHAYLRNFGKHPRRMRPLREMVELTRAAGFDIRQQQRFKATTFWGMMRIVGRTPLTNSTNAK
jgi:ubiquinone/menaquinone biosynthesis C-methylase UbiE